MKEVEGLPERLTDQCADAGSLPALADIEALKAAHVAASEALRAASRARLEAQRAVDAEHVPIIEKAKAALEGAQRAYDEAKAAQATHPWVGKAVARTVEKNVGSIWRDVKERIEERGIVEIVSPTNPWGGRKYQAPDPGTPVVRLLKKDGKPGAKHEQLNRYDWQTKVATPDGWTLVDAPPPVQGE